MTGFPKERKSLPRRLRVVNKEKNRTKEREKYRNKENESSNRIPERSVRYHHQMMK
jgi:hypothetical protein